VPEGVVDLLEAVDVDVERCRGPHRPPSPGQQLLGAVEHERPVGQLGQRVVQRAVAEQALGAQQIALREELPQQDQRGGHRCADRQPDALIQRRTELRADRQAKNDRGREVGRPPRAADAWRDRDDVDGARRRVRLRRARAARREGIEREADDERDVDEDRQRVLGMQEEPAVGHIAEDGAGEARDQEPERPTRPRGGCSQQDVGGADRALAECVSRALVLSTVVA
jgi:hypothetical protein